MKKSVTYIGTPDDETAEITHGGIHFHKNHAKHVEVDSDFDMWYGHNYTFKVEDIEEVKPVESSKPVERATAVAPARKTRKVVTK